MWSFKCNPIMDLKINASHKPMTEYYKNTMEPCRLEYYVLYFGLVNILYE